MYNGSREKDAETVLVSTKSDLAEAIGNKKKIKLDLDFFGDLVLKDHHYSKEITVIKLLEIMQNDNPVPRLEFGSHKWSSKELKYLTNLIANTQHITKIVFDAPNNAVNTIFEALESNTSVKQIGIRFSTDPKQRLMHKFYEKLCHGLENTNIHVEMLELFEEPTNHMEKYMDLVFEALKSAKWIKSLKINECLVLSNNRIQKIVEFLLQNQRITSVLMGDLCIPEQAVPNFVELIKMNHLKQLQVRAVPGQLSTRNLMFASLRENKSITDADIKDTLMDPKMLESILLNNKTILKLNCSVGNDGVTLVADSIVDALAKNTILTDLTIKNACHIERALLTNRTLRSLCIEDSQLEIDGDLIKRILQQNTTLTALNITCNNQNSDEMDLISAGLAANSTLKSFGCKLEVLNEISRKLFCAVLRDHQSLTHLNTQYTSNLSILRMVLPGFAEMIEEALKANLSLRSWSPYDSFEQFKPYFKRNIEIQEKNIRRTKTIIRMIVLKPNSFLLPIEIWSHIFNQLRFPGVNINFGNLFYC